MRFSNPLKQKILVVVLVFLSTTILFSGVVRAAVFTVNSNDDTDDTVCDVTHCSLREAINAANANADTDVINFNIGVGGVQTIQPTSPLPAITNRVTIDGTSQPGFVGTPIIELDGTNADDADGLVVAASNSTIKGLVINHFTNGIVLNSTSASITIQGNYIGTDLTGTSGPGNLLDGVLINGAANNTIGGTTVGSRNVISGNFSSGVRILGATATNNRIQGNFIGTNAAGTAALGNYVDGVTILNGSSANIIGGLNAGEGNVISGNNVTFQPLFGAGITLSGNANVVQGNKIGTDVTGTVGLRNGAAGIWLTGAINNVIGGTSPGAGNIIAFNEGDGIYSSNSAATVGNVYLGNSIFSNTNLGINLGSAFTGVTPNDPGDGDIALQNFPVLATAQSNGTATSVTGTLNSTANGGFMIEYFSSPTCDASGNGEGKVPLGTDGVESNGAGDAVLNVSLPAVTVGHFITATATSLQNNTSEFSACIAVTDTAQAGTTLIVTTAADTDDTVCGVGNCSLREAINAANANANTSTINFGIPGAGVHTIQPTTPLPLISNPTIIDGTTQPGYGVGFPLIELNGDLVVSALPEAKVGINIVGASNSTVRGLIINGWAYGGVGILNGNNNVVEGNFIGTDAAGTAAVPNLYGVIIYNGSNNRVGGTTAAQRNLISGNNDDGVNIGGQTPAQATANIVEGNYIGTAASGTIAMGNGDDGVKVEIATGTIIGGTSVDARNIIAASVHNGVILKGVNTVNSLVQGNHIGTDASGTIDLGNTLNGVQIEGAPNNTVGGTVAGAGNVIAFNDEDGIYVVDNTALGNRFLGNSIYDNAGLGIDLAANGVTGNDTGDADTGANNLQNFPVLTIATSDGTTTIITGTFNSEVSKAYRLEYFASPTCDGSGYGEGKTYIGFTSVTTNGSGDAVVNAVLSANVPDGQFITATATDPANNTSEFSACVTIERVIAVPPALPAAAPVPTFFTTLTPTLSWNVVSWAVGYVVQVDDNMAFTSPDTYNPASGTLSVQITVPSDGPYFWRVRALNATNTVTPWSLPQPFRVETP